MSTHWPEPLAGPVAAGLLAMAALAASPGLLAEEAGLKLSTTIDSTRLPATRARSVWDRLRSCDDGTDRAQGWLRHLASDEEVEFPRFGKPCDVDWHEPVFILPYTYSPDYESDQTEVLFGVSAKLRPLGPPLYFAYSQRSFWSLYDGSRSRPFRETVFNPEVFYRWSPSKPDDRMIWGLDGGYEHESNGEDIPQSRSWDRLYIAPFYERGGTAIQLKLWYRIPENRGRPADDPKRDDNPDIEQYLGYGEIRVFRRLNRNHRLNTLLRYHPSTHRGALEVQWLERLGEGDLFWMIHAFHGYGESLSDYDDSITRLGIGFALSR